MNTGGGFACSGKLSQRTLSLMLSNILAEISNDLQRLGAYASKIEGGMKIVVPLVLAVLAALGFGIYRTLEWWQTPFQSAPTYAIVPAALLVAILISYLTLVVDRARQPRLEVGELTPDNSTSSFDVKVKNLGPGKVRPTVTITHLRDGDGNKIGTAPESYQPREAHWRHAPEADWRPLLKPGQSAHSGVLWVDGETTPAPILCTYPNELKSLFRLWEVLVPLEQQSGLQLTFIVSYIRSSGRDAKRVERSYRIIPDKTEHLKYRIERVKGFD